jgi:Sec-independent protein translocase protein TatA
MSVEQAKESKAKYIQKLREEIRNYGKYTSRLQNEFRTKINAMRIEISQKDFELDSLKKQVKSQETKIIDQAHEIKRLSRSLQVLFDSTEE